MKKEFTSYWTEHPIAVEPDRLPYSQSVFFRTTTGGFLHESTMIVPSDMPIKELTCFLGKKTKVTIEVIE